MPTQKSLYHSPSLDPASNQTLTSRILDRLEHADANEESLHDVLLADVVDDDRELFALDHGWTIPVDVAIRRSLRVL